MKIVMDTYPNVLVSGLLNPNGPPARILNLIINRNVTLLIDNRIIRENIKVLERPKFGFKQEWMNPLIDFFRHESEYISAGPVDGEFPDSDLMSEAGFYEPAAKPLVLLTGSNCSSFAILQ